MASPLIELQVFESKEALAEAARDLFVDHAPRTVALAGAATPRRTYELLARAQLDWQEIDVFLGDERMVPPKHEESNWRMAQETLLSKVDARGHRVLTELPVDEAARRYENELRPRMPIDFSFLGIGVDGHTASLFDGDDALTEEERLVAPTGPRNGFARVTLTVPAFRQSRVCLFLVQGGGKQEALSRLMRGDDIPAARIAPMDSLVVYADREAANGLT